MRPPRTQRIRLDALGALRRRAAQMAMGTAAPRWTRSAASDRDPNPFRRAPTPLKGEDLLEAQSEPAPSKPWPKPKPTAAVPTPPARPRRLVEKTMAPDPPSAFRRRATPLDGEVLVNAPPVPPPRKPRTATTPAPSATTTGKRDGELPKQDPQPYFRGVPTPLEGEALIQPRDTSGKKRTPPPEPPKAIPLSPEEAKQLSLRKPELFDGEDAPIETPLSLLTDHYNPGGDDLSYNDAQWTEDDQSQEDAQWVAPVVPDRKTVQGGKIHPLDNIHIDQLSTSEIPAVAIRDSLRCIASFSEGPVTGNPPVLNLYVPGAPAIYRARKVPHALTPGPVQNAIKPSFPYESTFMAMRAMTDLCLDDVDVVITGSHLRSLFAICSDKRFVTDRFRPTNLCTLVRDTLVIHGMVEDDATSLKLRAKKLPRHLQSGHMFQDNFTEMPEETFDNTTYYRVLQYRLGNLNCMVLTETDAVLPYQRNADSDGQPSLEETRLSEEIPLDILPVPRGPDTGSGWRPRLVPAGKFAEHRTWTELKLGHPEFSDLMSQVYFCNNLFAVYGLHGWEKRADRENKERRNTVYGLTMHDLRDRVSTWEQEEQPALRRTVALLHRLRDVARRRGDGNTSMFWKTRKARPGEDHYQPPEAADEPADQPTKGAGKFGAEIQSLKACDMLVTVKTWHSPESPIPPELVDHFWTPPGNWTKPQWPGLVRYYATTGKSHRSHQGSSAGVTRRDEVLQISDVPLGTPEIHNILAEEGKNNAP